MEELAKEEALVATSSGLLGCMRTVWSCRLICAITGGLWKTSGTEPTGGHEILLSSSTEPQAAIEEGIRIQGDPRRHKECRAGPFSVSSCLSFSVRHARAHGSCVCVLLLPLQRLPWQVLVTALCALPCETNGKIICTHC